ncbi:unnamed protein product [Vitrella brassicaformis CCMP3155]|uniref:ABC transporter domain-containing protein n=2 Tax=Vitrella brassicaformis TaxID=1169539 RepID=A0A0G4FCT9_VITBC|nr:unnamed protein product [Vitrella brassicaformis CCMP3155]|eukprot:CEM10534.1 unnamed protein product [Vitrella brassicaformis CCMP3155]
MMNGEAAESVPAVSHDAVVIVLDNLFKTYLLGVEGVPALRGVSLTITKGEFVTILGKSGGGKTTMLNIIGTIDKPTKGSLWLCGHRIHSQTFEDFLAALRLSQIGFVFQTFNLISSLSALENVCLPMMLLGRLTSDQIRQRAERLLTEVGLGHRLKHMPNMLSGGEQQRVTIARALANEPSILLLDEPTGDLDSHSSDVIMQMLYNLNRDKSITTVMVTHDVSLKNFGSRVIHMVDGKIQREERIADIDRIAKSSEIAQRLHGGSATSDVDATSRPPAPIETFSTTRTLDDYDALAECMA